MITFFDLLVVAGILAMAYRGWVVGLETAGVAALELLACLAVAVLLHEVAAGFLHMAFALVLGEVVGQSWCILLSFSGLAWGSFALVRFVWHRLPDGDGEGDEQDSDIDPLSDRLGGALAGAAGGVVLLGGLLITLSMIPFLAGLKPSGDRMLLDVGKTILRVADTFLTERHEGRSIPIWGEPASRVSNLAARLTSEPWFDVDDDGTFTTPDRYRDVDGNGTFSKDLYYEDVDGDNLRRIGLMDKYAAGRWDGELISNERPRPALKQPDPQQPATAKPTPGLGAAGRPDSKPPTTRTDNRKPGDRPPPAGTKTNGKNNAGRPAEDKENPADEQLKDDF
jgi:hypothetical protein